jgi:hypothetical protein
MAQIVLSSTYATNVVAVSMHGGEAWSAPDGLDVIAAVEPSTQRVTVRAVNKAATSVHSTITVAGCKVHAFFRKHLHEDGIITNI